MAELAMQLRGVDVDGRTITGVVAPYDEISYLTPDPAGERIVRGAFRKSIEQRGRKVLLFTGHDNKAAGIGHASSWVDGADGLTATFTVSQGVRGDQALDDVRAELYGGLSVGFRPLVQTRGEDGVREVREAALVEVSLVGVPAYDGARVLAVRAAVPVFDMPPRPVVDLSPIPAVWLYDSAR
jgi:hypothetical protein